MPEQTKSFFWNNQNLFSNNYLEHHLPTTSLWTEQREKIKDIFETVKKSYETIQALKPGQGQEAELEDKFIRPVLTALGYEYSVQPVTKRGFKKKRPDYALFKDSKAIKAASADKENLQKFFSQSLTILESKYWNRRLNDSDKNDILDSRDPTAQTVKYLEDVHLHTDGKINWAILTNGKHWRLFYHKAASRAGNYFEIDLEEIITSGDAERFLYFYLFFSKDVFIPDSVTGRTWLDQHLKGTEEYAVRVSTKLKDLIFDKVFEGLAEGFVHYRISELSRAKETEESRKDIFKGCLTLLYRLLFLLYAESRNLLPIGEDGYSKVSLSKLKKDIYKDLSATGLDKMSKRSYVYWARLESLFDIIAHGDPVLNVPIYNGGLFETPKDGFLSVHKMPDPFLAEAIELLTVDHEAEHAPESPAFIDYSSLNVRHLGDIYEGLLEFHVQIADEEMIEVKEKGKSLWKKSSEIKSGTKTSGKKARGEVYIENSKHERKATGSYYTPHYIVEYIVKNTVGSVLDEKLKTADDLLLEHEEASKALRKQKSTSGIQGYRIKIKEIEDKISDAIFGIKVLDPAMGSGHFLVHAVDVVSDRIVLFLAGYPENPVIRKIHELRNEILAEIKRQGVRIDESRLTEVNLIKRMVMKRCIYGVDLNEMAVELAKLSLWLDSFTLGAPLSFLDHHLKCGNSLIGTNIEELEKALTGHLFAINLEPLKRAIGGMIFVSDLPDATVAQVRESYKRFGEANSGLEGYRILLDMLIAEHFGIADAKKMLVSDFDKIDLNNLYASIEKLPDKDRKLMESAKAITKEKKFFHWEIEFPEVFYEKAAVFGQKIDKKENSGFDCVIGNPPYIQLSMDETLRNSMQAYLLERFVFSMGRLNTFGFFTKLGLELSKLSGLVSMIIPNTFLTMPYYSDFRENILQSARIDSFLLFDSLPFEDAVVENIVYVFQKTTDNTKINKNKVTIYEASEILKGTSKPVRAIPQSLYQQLFEKAFNPYLDDQLIRLFDKLNANNTLLTSLVEINQAIALKHDRDKYLTPNPQGLQYKKVLDGRDIDRYSLDFSGTYLKYSRDAIHSCKREDIFTSPEKLFFRRVGDKIIATVDNEQHYALNTLVVINRKVSSANLMFLLSLLNSRLLTWYFNSFLKSIKDVFSEIQARQMEQLPIPRISFTTSEKERRERVEEAMNLYEKEIKKIAINADKWQNKGEVKGDDKGRDKESPAKARKVAGKSRRYKLAQEGISREDIGLGGEVYGVREGAGEYEPPEGTPRKGEGSTRPLDSTCYFETAQGIKTYSEVAEILAVSVAKSIELIIDGTPEDIHITPEWTCRLHGDIASSLFPDWAGRFRDVNVQVGSHIPPPYFEVPVHMRLYCEDLAVRLSGVSQEKDTEKVAETLAYADWRFQWIHPFKDLNGRVGRILLSAILFRLKLPPAETATVDPEGEKRYLKALHEADAGDLSYLNEIWMERLSDAIKEREEK